MQDHPGPAPGIPLIIVLGAGVQADGSASRVLRRRMEKAVLLSQHWPDARIILSGGRGRRHPPGAPAEAQVMAELATAAGLEAHRLVLEARSATTLENAVLSLDLAARMGATAVLVVTDRPHHRRALLAFRAVARARRLPIAVKGDPAPGPHDLMPALSARAYEALATLVYRWRLARGAALAVPRPSPQDQGADGVASAPTTAPQQDPSPP